MAFLSAMLGWALRACTARGLIPPEPIFPTLARNALCDRGASLQSRHASIPRILWIWNRNFAMPLGWISTRPRQGGDDVVRQGLHSTRLLETRSSYTRYAAQQDHARHEACTLQDGVHNTGTLEKAQSRPASRSVCQPSCLAAQIAVGSILFLKRRHGWRSPRRSDSAVHYGKTGKEMPADSHGTVSERLDEWACILLSPMAPFATASRELPLNFRGDGLFYPMTSRERRKGRR